MASPINYIQAQQGFPAQQPPKPYYLQNQSAPDPWLLDFQKSWQARLGELRADEGQLRADTDARTRQLIAQSSGDISDRAAGANASLDENLARRGVAGAGVEAGERGKISEAAQRQQAREATNITLTQNQAYEDRKLARQNQLNQFLAAGAGAAGAIGQRQLDAQRLGLEQYRTMNAEGDKEREDFGNYYKQKPVYRGVPGARRPGLG